MDVFYTTIAGFLIKIVFKKDLIQQQASELIIYMLQSEILYTLGGFVSVATKNPDFTIEFSETKDAERIRRQSDQHNFVYQYHKKNNNTAVASYQISIWQFQSMLSDILYFLLSKNDGFGIHCSSAYFGRKAFLFLGNSGAGKSTIIQLLDKTFQPFTDDVALIRRQNGKFYLYQTPFLEKNNIVKFPFSYEISKVFFLHKSSKTYMKVSSQNKDVGKFEKQVLFDRKLSIKTQKLLKQFTSQNIFYELYFEKNSLKLSGVLKNPS